MDSGKFNPTIVPEEVQRTAATWKIGGKSGLNNHTVNWTAIKRNHCFII